jgi:hypothetical protein
MFYIYTGNNEMSALVKYVFSIIFIEEFTELIFPYHFDSKVIL